MSVAGKMLDLVDMINDIIDHLAISEPRFQERLNGESLHPSHNEPNIGTKNC